MNSECQNKLAMISEELYATDWAGRFDTFETFHGASRVSVDRILDQLEVLAKSNLKSINTAANSKMLLSMLDQHDPSSSEWLWVSVLLKVSSIRICMQKNLGHSAVLGSIHLMHSLFHALEREEFTEQTDKAKKKAPVKKLKPKPSTDATETASRRLQSVPVRSPMAQTNLSGNVVLKQLVTEEEPHQEGVSLSKQCHEVAEELADKYPEYTLTAIRVLTAEKLGVSRQYLENLGVTPRKFRKS